MWGRRDPEAERLRLDLEETRQQLLTAVDKLNGIVERLQAVTDDETEQPQ